MTWHDVERGVGRRGAWAAVAAVAIGVAAVATGLGPDEAARTSGALVASWMFFAGIAAGAAAFRAFFRIVDARWARPLAPVAGALAGFAPAAVLLLAFVVSRVVVAPWVANASGWLAPRSLAVRELATGALLLGFAWLWFGERPGRREAPSRGAAVAYLLAYAAVLSVWGFDFVVGPDPVFASTLVGAHVFVGAFVAATGAVVLVGLAAGVLPEASRRDAGALVLALAIFWAYLFWSQFLTIWYANLPDEIGFALRRSVDGWGWVVLSAIGLVFAAPFVGLVHPAARRSRSFVGAILAAQLVGLWLDRHLLVVPSLSARGTPPIDLRDLAIAAGMLGVFVLSVAPGLGRALAPAGEPAHDPGPAPDAAPGRQAQRA
jgi:hypothetical protein